MLVLDHLAVSGETLDEATAHVEQALGVAMQPGGEHAVFHTHNTLMGLENGLYLEAIAINPEAPRPTRPRWFDLDRFTGPPRLTNWICRCDDLDAAVAVLKGTGASVDLQRGELRWRMAVPDNGQLPFDNCHPALIQWQTSDHPAGKLAPTGCTLQRLIVSHPQAADLRSALGAHLSDDRLVFLEGPAALRAEFDTPHGVRVLE